MDPFCFELSKKHTAIIKIRLWHPTILILYELSRNIWQYVLCVFFARFVLKFIDFVSLTRKTVKFTAVLIRDEKLLEGQYDVRWLGVFHLTYTFKR